MKEAKREEQFNGKQSFRRLNRVFVFEGRIVLNVGKDSFNEELLSKSREGDSHTLVFALKAPFSACRVHCPNRNPLT